MQHRITFRDGRPTAVTLLTDEGVQILGEGHPRFEGIVTALVRDGDEAETEVRDLADVFGALVRATNDGRVVAINGRLYLDGERVPSDMEDVVATSGSGTGDDLTALAAFVTRIADCDDDVRENLPAWLKQAGLRVDEDGNIWGYKAVRKVGEGFESFHAGPRNGNGDGVRVDGVPVTGHVPQAVGSKVTMPRDAVDADRGVGCGTGLHVGSLDYAEDFGGGGGGDSAMLLVRVRPEDVVSVPSHARFRKMRVCAYEVMAVMPWTTEDAEAERDIPVHGMYVPVEQALSRPEVAAWATATA